MVNIGAKRNRTFYPNYLSIPNKIGGVQLLRIDECPNNVENQVRWKYYSQQTI